MSRVRFELAFAIGLAACGGDVVITIAGGDAAIDSALDLRVDAAADFADAACTWGFAPQVMYAVGDRVVSIAAGDFDHDGLVDLVVANDTDQTLGVMFNQGHGLFSAPVTFAAPGIYLLPIVVADLNGDGYPDVAVLHGGVGVFLNAGDGTFEPQATYAVNLVLQSLTVGDFNGDGFPDLVGYEDRSGSLMGPPGVNAVGILLNAGNGTFGAETSYALNFEPSALASGDFNGDGLADLAVGGVNYIAWFVSVMFNTDNGTFGAPTTYGLGNDVTALVVGDFNGDGALDLAGTLDVDNMYSDEGSVFVWLNDGHGKFTQRGVSPVSGYTGWLAVGDFNGDGASDLVVANPGDNTVSVLLNGGNGTLAAGVTYAVGIEPEDLAVGDFNGDGVADIAVANIDDNVANADVKTVSVLLSECR